MKKKLVLVIVSMFAVIVIFTSPGCVNNKGSNQLAPDNKDGRSNSNKDGRFIADSKRIVLDTKTGLMWAAEDNGKGISWHDAKKYCNDYKAGGYKDWRLPSLDELSELYDKSKSYPMECRKGYNVHLTQLIHISCWEVWSSEIKEDGSLAFSFNFYTGDWLWGPLAHSDEGRVLPVRGGNL